MGKKPTTTQPSQVALRANHSVPAFTGLQQPVTAVSNLELLSLASLSAAILHAYPRYGLAVAAHQSQLTETITEAELRAALLKAIEAGLGQFRMLTRNNSLHDKVLKFETVRLTDLADNPQLVQSAGLAAQGIYLFPTLVTTDSSAKDTFRNAQEITKQLRGQAPLSSTFTLNRSFAPTTAKINSGTASQSPPIGTLLEAACAVVTTVTPLKPAAWLGVNTVIIPNLPLPQLREFILVFEEMLAPETNNLLSTWERALPSATEIKASSRTVTAEFRRPRLHAGNYPGAPRDAWAFGPAGLLGAVGRWARRTKQQSRGRAVLDALAGQPLYVISYDQIDQVCFDQRITRLALDDDLTSIVNALYLGTRFYSEVGTSGPPFNKPEFKIFYLLANRFLQSFTNAAFIDFLAFGAEYAAETRALFTEYFYTMIPAVSAAVVESASELGRWLNRTAYFAAKAEAEDFPSKKKGKDQQIKETKARFLVELESVVLGAKSPEAMISQVLTQAGRISIDEAPAGARRFVDAANKKEIGHDQAKHLLISYMRLRSTSDSSTPQLSEEQDASSSTPTKGGQAIENHDQLTDK